MAIPLHVFLRAREAPRLLRSLAVLVGLWPLACTATNPAYQPRATVTVGPPGVADAAVRDAAPGIDRPDAAPVFPDAGPTLDAADAAPDSGSGPAPDAAMDGQTDSSLSSGLVARYRLDPVAGTAVPDDSGTRPGTASGTVTWPDGFPDAQFSNPGALGLDGSSGFVLLPAVLLPDVSGEKSISLWFWLAAPLADYRRTLLSINNSADLGIQLGLERGAPAVWVWNAAAGNLVVEASAVAPAGWTHLVYTHSAGTHALYLNGVLADSSTSSYRAGATTQILLGAFEPDRGEEERWPGRIDDLRIYDRALTPTEITALATGVP